MADVTKVYTGAVEQVFPGWLAIAGDGSASTLLGVPGGEPVTIRKAAGSADSALQVPGGGWWADPPTVSAAKDSAPGEDTAEPAAKPRKTT